MSGKKFSAVIIPVMLSFFAMGFVDMVGTATNYIKADFGLSDAFANLCTTMVFFWFLIVSIPTGALMNRIGRRKTTLLSLAITAVALLVPVLNYSAVSMTVSFCLLGIGNAIMQVSLNPLVVNIVSGDRLASTMTFGQFVKAICSFIAPLVASWGAVQFDNWRVMFPIFMAVAVIAVVSLGLTNIREGGIQRNRRFQGQLLAARLAARGCGRNVCRRGLFALHVHGVEKIIQLII